MFLQKIVSNRSTLKFAVLYELSHLCAPGFFCGLSCHDMISNTDAVIVIQAFFQK